MTRQKAILIGGCCIAGANLLLGLLLWHDEPRVYQTALSSPAPTLDPKPGECVTASGDQPIDFHSLHIGRLRSDNTISYTDDKGSYTLRELADGSFESCNTGRR